MGFEPRDWSVITAERLDSYVLAASTLVEHARRKGIHPFAAALAGVAFIRNALSVMGGKVDWWLELVRTGEIKSGPANEVERGRAE